MGQRSPEVESCIELSNPIFLVANNQCQVSQSGVTINVRYHNQVSQSINCLNNDVFISPHYEPKMTFTITSRLYSEVPVTDFWIICTSYSQNDTVTDFWVICARNSQKRHIDFTVTWVRFSTSRDDIVDSSHNCEQQVTSLFHHIMTLAWRKPSPQDSTVTVSPWLIFETFASHFQKWNTVISLDASMFCHVTWRQCAQ